MGGRSAEELFWTKLYESLSKNIYLTTDDGSVGTKYCNGPVAAAVERGWL